MPAKASSSSTASSSQSKLVKGLGDGDYSNRCCLPRLQKEKSYVPDTKRNDSTGATSSASDHCDHNRRHPLLRTNSSARRQVLGLNSEVLQFSIWVLRLSPGQRGLARSTRSVAFR